MHITKLVINENISKMSAPVADPLPVGFHLDDAPAPVDPDAAAWAAWRGETFYDLPPAPVAPPTDPTAASWDAWRRSTFTDL